MSPRSKLALGLSSFFSFLAIVCVGFIAYRHYREVTTDFEPAPMAQSSRHPEQLGIANLQEVSFRSRDGVRLSGWYVPSNDRAAIVVTHGTNADRSSMLPETRILADAGFGVLAFDWPGNGASEGKIRWNVRERQALAAAVDWLAQRPEVDPDRLGGLGFSMGGYVMAQVAARDVRLHAIVLLATPADYAELTRWQNKKWGLLSELPADLALRNSGMPVTEERPIDVVRDISPRPVLLIGGDADATVPVFMTRALFDAAGDPKALWIVPGAQHGQYARFAGEAYASRLVQFFTSGLKPAARSAQASALAR